MIRSYREIKKINSFEERYLYLQLKGKVGMDTFGFDRYINQMLYTSKRWKKSRDEVIIRDNGCDLGIEGFEIHGKILVHHMNVITVEDIELERDVVYNPEFLITTTLNTHNAIHFGDISLLKSAPIERSRNDTCPWK